MKDLLKDTCGPGARQTKMQVSSSPDHLWPEFWSGMSTAPQPKEKQQRAIDKPKLDNARKKRRHLFLIRMMESSRKPLTTHGKVGDADGGGYAL